MLLLSATPYKMYTLAQEAEEDDHYADFLRTVAFLQGDERQTQAFEQLLIGYRRCTDDLQVDRARVTSGDVTYRANSCEWEA